MGVRKYPKELNEQLRNFVSEGHSRQETMERFSVPYHIVARACKGIDALAVRNAALRSYKSEGHTMQEVADHFGITKEVVRNVCVGIAPQSVRNHRNQWSDSDTDERGREYVAKYAPDFEYVSGYEGCDAPFLVKCKVCGHIEKRSPITMRKKGIRCEACYRAEIERGRTEREEEKAKEDALKERKRKERTERAAWNRYEKSIKQARFCICKHCGNLFITMDRHKSGERSAYCSAECAKAEANKTNKDKRIKKLNAVVIDKDITLERLAKRDGNICALCGGVVDWDDYYIRDDGTFIAGQSYPSVDHIVPLSLEGEHSWSNVQLAHRACNTKKSNLPIIRGA